MFILSPGQPHETLLTDPSFPRRRLRSPCTAAHSVDFNPAQCKRPLRRFGDPNYLAIHRIAFNYVLVPTTCYTSYYYLLLPTACLLTAAYCPLPTAEHRLLLITPTGQDTYPLYLLSYLYYVICTRYLD